MTDYDLLGVDLGFVSDVAAMAATIDFHGRAPFVKPLRGLPRRGCAVVLEQGVSDAVIGSQVLSYWNR
jgi:hypothetical protein